jgi:hypothetical protein
MVVHPEQTVQAVQRRVAQDTLDRCAQTKVDDISFAYSLHHDPVSIPSVMLKFTVLSVLFRLNHPRKWQRALKEGWIPDELLQWLGVQSLEELAEQSEVGWIPPKLFLDALGQQCGRVLIELAQPRASAFIREVIRSLFLRKAQLCDGGLVMRRPYWKWFLRQAHMPLRPCICDEVHQGVDSALGQFELAQVAPRHWRPIPQLTESNRQILEAAVVDPAPARLEGLTEALEAGLFDFIPNLFASPYSAHGRRAYHPLVMWKVLLAMISTGVLEPQAFLRKVNDSLHLRLFLEVMKADELPSPRRVKGFLTDRLPAVIE